MYRKLADGSIEQVNLGSKEPFSFGEGVKKGDDYTYLFWVLIGVVFFVAGVYFVHKGVDEKHSSKKKRH